MGRLIKQALYSYRHEQEHKRIEREKRFKFMHDLLFPSCDEHKFIKKPNFYNCMKIIQREKDD